MKLINPESLGWCQACGYCRSLEEDRAKMPLPTAAVGRDGLTIHSSLVLLEEDELDFYRARALALSSLRGRSVEHGGRAAGSLRDVVLAPSGSLLSVVVEHAGRTERLPFDQTLRIAPEARTAA